VSAITVVAMTRAVLVVRAVTCLPLAYGPI